MRTVPRRRTLCGVVSRKLQRQVRDMDALHHAAAVTGDRPDREGNADRMEPGRHLLVVAALLMLAASAAVFLLF